MGGGCSLNKREEPSYENGYLPDSKSGGVAGSGG